VKPRPAPWPCPLACPCGRLTTCEILAGQAGSARQETKIAGRQGHLRRPDQAPAIT
jgi:hypothetical protein